MSTHLTQITKTRPLHTSFHFQQLKSSCTCFNKQLTLRVETPGYKLNLAVDEFHREFHFTSYNGKLSSIDIFSFFHLPFRGVRMVWCGFSSGDDWSQTLMLLCFYSAYAHVNSRFLSSRFNHGLTTLFAA